MKDRIINFGEVFTPPDIVKAMVDMAPEAYSVDAKFLEPSCGNGNFLVEILRRKLSVGLKGEDSKEKAIVVAVSSLYGIDIIEDNVAACRSRLLALAREEYERVVQHEIPANIYDVIQDIINKNIIHGNTLTGNNDNGSIEFFDWNFNADLTPIPKRFILCTADDGGIVVLADACDGGKGPILFSGHMKFDVVIGNPPYQAANTGHNRSATPIYYDFVEFAMNVALRRVIMIIPSRWFADHRGNRFKKIMLDGNHLRKIVDYATPTGVFDDVIIAGGVCYFHWDREYDGLCEFVNMYETGPVSSIRDLNKFEILVRHSNAAPIIEKVLSFGYETLDNYVSPRKPFGIPSNYKPRREGVPCWFRRSQGVLYADPQDIVDKTAALHKWKVIAPIFPISGRCRFDRPIRFYRDYDIYIAKPGECCTESWIILRSFDVEDEAVSFRSYIRTKLIRFLILQSVIAQHCSRSYFRFVPDLSPYSGIYTDEMLCEMWNISKEEWSFVDWLVKN